MLTLTGLLTAAILAVLGLRVRAVMKAERDMRPGSPPGTGHHVIRAEYFSGGGGGGESTEYTVPKDPQDYARLFVPKERTGK